MALGSSGPSVDRGRLVGNDTTKDVDRIALSTDMLAPSPVRDHYLLPAQVDFSWADGPASRRGSALENTSELRLLELREPTK